MDNNFITKSNFAIGKALEGNIKIKSSEDKLEELKSVTNQFEAIFVNQVLTSLQTLLLLIMLYLIEKILNIGEM